MTATHTMAQMALAGCTTDRGIRHWESLGLLGEVARSEAGQRLFTDEQLDRARIITAASFAGWELFEIKTMLEGYHTDYEIYQAIMVRLDQQIMAATRLAQNLPKTLAKYVPPAALEYDL